MRKRLLVMCAAGCMAVMAVAGNAWAAGNSDAAQSCQKGGYLTVGLPYGMTFKNTGDCVSYFAQNKTACVPTATSGCVTFDNVVIPSETVPGGEITLSGAFSFNAGGCPLTGCTLPNALATGGATYSITNPDTPTQSGQLVASDTLGGLAGALFLDNNDNTTTCANAITTTNGMAVAVIYATTGNSFMEIAAGRLASGRIGAEVLGPGIDFYVTGASVPGLTFAC